MANPNRSWNNLVQGTFNSLGSLSLFKRKASSEDGFVMVNRAQAGPRYEGFPFHLLPAEIRIMVVQALGSEFFCENVRRLTICREWYSAALPVMYNNMSIGRISHPNTPWDHGFNTAEPVYRQHAYNQLDTYLRNCTLNLDSMLRRYQFVPGDCDSSDYPDIFSRRHIDDLKADRNWKRFHIPPKRGEPWDPQDGLFWGLYRLSYLSDLPRLEQFEVKMREPWGIHRRQVAAFDTGLWYMLGAIGGLRREPIPSNLSVLILDIPGLARRKTRWSEQNEIDGMLDPLFYLDEGMAIGLDDDEAHEPNRSDSHLFDSFTRHVCTGVNAVLPRLEVLHLRLRSVCPSLFRDWEHETRPWLKAMYPHIVDDDDDEDGIFADLSPELDEEQEPPPEVMLPKLKEIIVNMIMPQGRFKSPRVVHCCTFDCNLTETSDHNWATIATQEAKKEIVRFAQRLPNASKVVLRYAVPSEHAADTPNMGHRYVPRRYDIHEPDYFEFDALTEKARRIKVDKWGDFVCYIDPDAWYLVDSYGLVRDTIISATEC